MHVYVLAYAGESSMCVTYFHSCKNGRSDPQRQSRAKTSFCVMHFGKCSSVGLSWYRANGSRSWAVGKQKFREVSSYCWLRGSYCGILIEYVEQRQRKQMLLELPLTWKGLSPHRPHTPDVCEDVLRFAWWLFVYCTSPCAGEDWFVSICHRRFRLEPWRNTPRCSAELWPRSTRKSVSSSLSLTPF